jgi:hypothetical protein
VGFRTDQERKRERERKKKSREKLVVALLRDARTSISFFELANGRTDRRIEKSETQAKETSDKHAQMVYGFRPFFSPFFCRYGSFDTVDSKVKVDAHLPTARRWYNKVSVDVVVT